MRESGTLHSSSRQLPVVSSTSAAGSSLNVRDKDGHTPLHLAVANHHYRTVQLLLELGAHVDSTTRSAPPPPPSSPTFTITTAPSHRFDVTPLHLAASVGHTPCVELLVKYGAHINAQESWGQTPLTIATLGGRLVTIKSLLRLGADPGEGGREAVGDV